jgi:phytoene dehydrogenase-like protein
MEEKERERWDAIVIGSGLGGLSSAAYLAAAGKRTLVLESHHVAGGNSQDFRRRIRGREYEFDVGLHYIGECGPDGLITTILRGVGLAERVVFRPLEPDGYSTLIFPDFTFRIPASWEKYRARLIEQFPGEAEPLGQVVDILRQVGRDGRRVQAGDLSFAQLPEEAPLFMQWGVRPVTDLFAEYKISRQAQAVIVGESGAYAVPPGRTPVALQAGFTDHYMRGAYYPEGGGQVIAGRLVEAIRAYGGEVRTRARVENIRVENGRALGVRMHKDGRLIDAPIVVSNADLKRTVTDLVGREHFSPTTVGQVDSYRMALPLFVVYLGLKTDLSQRALPNTNWFLYDSYDIEGMYAKMDAGEMPDDDFIYLTVASIKDPTNRHLAPEGYTNLQVMTLVPRLRAWHVEKDQDAGNAHVAGVSPKERAGQAHRGRRRIRSGETSTGGGHPITQERFTSSTGGTSYGIELSCDQAGPMRMGPETEIEGLYLCGGGTPSGHGIGSVLRSGVAAAGAALDTNLLRMVNAGEVLGDRDRLPPLREDWDALRECG